MADTVGFEVLPRRWVVERTLAWLNRNRRLAKDFEASIASAQAWVYVASVQLLIRRLACSSLNHSINQTSSKTAPAVSRSGPPQTTPRRRVSADLEHPPTELYDRPSGAAVVGGFRRFL